MTGFLLGAVLADLIWRAFHGGHSSGVGMLGCAIIALILQFAKGHG